MENYDQIVLTGEEAAEALRKAREEKYYRLKKDEYFRSLDAPRAIFKPSAGDWLNAYRERFVTDSDNSAIVIQLCAYFAQDDTFTGSHKKGVFLFGGVGTGKSTLMHFFRFNAAQSYRVVSARKIENEYSEQGEEILMHYSEDKAIASNTDPYGHQKLALCIDDMGTELEGKHYGKSRNVIGEILQNRYDAGLITHITSNASAEDIRNIYGQRVADRLREMVNIITFPESAKSRRR